MSDCLTKAALRKSHLYGVTRGAADWCKVLGCTPEQLREAVDHAGTTPEEVRQFLRAKNVGSDAYGRDPRVGDGSRMDAEGGDASPEMVECWYWRYRDPGTG